MPQKCFYLYFSKAIRWLNASTIFHLLLFWQFVQEVKILLCLQFATFMTHYFTFTAIFFRLQASDLLLNHFLNVINFIFALSKGVKFVRF
jgi:hypothetical protein